MISNLRLLTVPLGIMLLAGCGSSNLPETVPVEGRVTFAGGGCPGPGTVHFAPLAVAEGLPRRPGRADFGTDGRFTVTSFRSGDGLVPGTYRTRVECWKVEPANGQPGDSYLPANFATPNLTVSIGQRQAEFVVDAP